MPIKIKRAKERIAFELSEWAGLARERLQAMIDGQQHGADNERSAVRLLRFATDDEALLAVWKALKG